MDNSYNPFHNPDNDPAPLVKAQHTDTVIRPTVQTNIVDDYEPFQNQPAILQTETNVKVQPKVTLENLEKLQKDLEDRSRILAEEEERLRDPERQASINNFPPFPRCCPIKPCFYQAIDVEIPEQHRLIVRMGFILWLTYSATLFVNIFGTLSFMISRKMQEDTGPLFIVSIVCFVLFVPLGYILWFRPLYKAFRSNSSFNFFMFFLVFAAQIIILLIQVLGIKVLGSCGWIVSITGPFQNIGIQVFMMIIAVALTLELAFCIYIMIKVHQFFRSSGSSINKAKEEISQEAASSSTIRNAASGMLSSGR